MAVLDTLRNNQGIQSLLTGLESTYIQGKISLVAHTDGNLYAIWSESYLNAVIQQRLMFSKSTDSGATWSTPATLTTGNCDAEPCALQLDKTSTTSDIGVVFTRQSSYTISAFPVISMLKVDTSGTLTMPATGLGGSPLGRHPCIEKTSTGYLVACTIGANEDYNINLRTNTSFSSSGWTSTTLTIFPSSQEAFSLSLRRFANGHHALIAAYRTGLNGTLGVSAEDYLVDNVKCDVGVVFSSNDGVSWTSVQNLTNYSGSAGISSTGLTNVADADLIELSDGTIVVAYQEYKSASTLNASTTPAATMGSVQTAPTIYHSAKGYIIFGGDSAANGGVFIANLSTGTITRLHTGSTPALTSNQVRWIDLSSDEKYLAVGTSSGIDIIDTTNASIASWTKTNLSTSSTPSIRLNQIATVKFDGATNLYFSYDGATITSCFGGWVNASTLASVTDLLTPAGMVAGSPTIRRFVIAGSSIVYCSANKAGKTNKTTGVGQYYVALGYSNLNNWDLQYDDLNGEFLAITYDAVPHLVRITDSGAALTVAETFYPTSNPATFCNYGLAFPIPGVGCLYEVQDDTFNPGIWFWYSFGNKTPTGIVSKRKESLLSDFWPKRGTTGLPFVRTTNSSAWLTFSIGGGVSWIDITKLGRIRYGYFTYNSTTKQLVTSGVDFYDMVNTSSISTYNKLRFPRLARTSNDTIFVGINQIDLTSTTKQFKVAVGKVSISGGVLQLSAKARIQRSESTTLSMRGRIGTAVSTTLSAKARIVYTKTMSMKAKLTAASATIATMSMRALIYGTTTTDTLFTYNVQATVRLATRWRYWVNNGRYTLHLLSGKARIQQSYATNLTGHFLVKMASRPSDYVVYTFSNTSVKTIGMKARITK